jgi:hypothetical protein
VKETVQMASVQENVQVASVQENVQVSSVQELTNNIWCWLSVEI